MMREVRRFYALVVEFEGECDGQGRTKSGQLLIDQKLIQSAADPEAFIDLEIAHYLRGKGGGASGA